MGNIYDNEDFVETNDILNSREELYISSGHYDSARRLVNEINNVLGTITKIIAPKLEYNELNNTVSIIPGLIDNTIKVYPFFGTEIENILGLKNRNMDNDYYSLVGQSNGIALTVFKGDEMYKQNKLLAFHPVEISGGYHSLFVYSDIVYPSYIGDTCTQILRVVEIPRKAKFGEQCVIKYENSQYRRLLLSEFESIEISIKDDSGELIPFKFGRVIVTLHFKKL